MELDFREILLCHLKHITRVGKENVASLGIERHELMLAVLEGFEGFFVITLYPASLIKAYWFPAALGVILVQQAVLDNLKLQLPHSTNNLAVVELVYK